MENWLLMVSIFPAKKEMKDSAERFVAGDGGLSSDLKMEESLQFGAVDVVKSRFDFHHFIQIQLLDPLMNTVLQYLCPLSEYNNNNNLCI